ncbi:TetR/AcrR family transcriptional regulator [Nonomuraea helvata]|uniref:TetR/AcrR family transcriptional regulator n=1 Tax=Nonomuraea helvata TaxID=37484 RepID=A0ABV5S9V0_9ACTN
MPPKRKPAGAAVPQAGVTAAIERAMFDELLEKGYARMSMEAVARRAGVGKAALYRRWPSKEAMLVDLVGDLARQHIPHVPDTGTLDGDVRAFLDTTLAQMRDPQINKIALDLVAEAGRCPTLGDALREVVSRPRRAAAEEVLGRAIERGDVPAGLDLQLGIDLMISPLTFRLVIASGPVDGDYLTRLTRSVVAAIRAS